MTPTAIIRAGLVAVALSGTMLTAAPVQAQKFSIEFGFGGKQWYGKKALRLCLLSDRALRKAISSQGYRNIYLNVANKNRIQARATRGKWVYLLVVNSCTGKILARERLRRR